MASRRRDRLNPAASPTGSFVQPGVSGPLQTNFNFGALSQLSSTILQIDDYNKRIKEQDEAKAKELAPEQAALIAQAAADGRLPKKTVTVIQSGGKITKETAQKIKDMGGSLWDSDLGRMAVRQTLARQQVYDLDYEGHLKDPEWYNTYTKLALTDDKAAQEALIQRRAEFNELMGPVSAVNLGAVASEMAAVERSWKQKARDDKDEQARRLDTVNMANQVGLVIKSSLGALRGTEGPENKRQAIDAIKDYYEQAKLLRTSEEAETILMTGIRAKIMELAETEGEAALAVLDDFKDAFPSVSLSKNFEAITSAANSAASRLTEKQRDAHPKAARGLAGSLYEYLQNNPGEKLSSVFASEGEAERLAAKWAEDTGADYYGLLGQLPRLKNELSDFRARQVTESDPAEVATVDRLRNKGLLEDAEQYARESPDISEGDRRTILEDIKNEKRKEIYSPEASKARDLGASAVVKDLGEMPEGTQSEVFSLAGAYNGRFNTFLSNNPGKIDEAREFATKETKASAEYLALKERTVQNTPSFWGGDMLDKLIQPQIESLATRYRDELSNLADPQAKNDMGLRQQAELRSLKSSARRDIAELMKSPDFQKMESTDARKNYLEEELGKRSRDLQQRSQVGADIAVGGDRKLLGLGRLEAMARTDFDPSRVAHITGGLAPLNWFSFGNTAYEIANSAAQGFLGSVYSGGDISWTTVNQHRELWAMTELTASAKALGAGNPDIDTPEGRMLSGFTTKEEALTRLRGQLEIRGVDPQEVINGDTRYGVPFTDIFEGGTEAFPVDRVALYDSVEDLEKAVADLGKEDSELAQVMQALKYDPKDSKQVEGFASLQTRLITRRGGDTSGVRYRGGIAGATSVIVGSSALRKLREPLKVRSSDTAWLKALKERATK